MRVVRELLLVLLIAACYPFGSSDVAKMQSTIEETIRQYFQETRGIEEFQMSHEAPLFDRDKVVFFRGKFRALDPQDQTWTDGDYFFAEFLLTEDVPKLVKLRAADIYIVQETFDARAFFAQERKKVRTWTSNDGKFSTEARLVKKTANDVVLFTDREITVPLSRLSEEDKQWLKDFGHNSYHKADARALKETDLSIRNCKKNIEECVEIYAYSMAEGNAENAENAKKLIQFWQALLTATESYRDEIKRYYGR
jgi:nuclear transport factor 2 (NTF2) superfamily protein